MKKAGFLLCLSIFLSINLIGQPKLGLDKTFHDFGTLQQTADGVCLFTLSNIGNDTLRVTDVRPECGCTASDLAKYTLVPGESTTLKLTYATSHAYGGFDKRVSIQTNCNPAVVSVSIKGTVAVKSTFPTQIERTSELLVNKSEFAVDTIDERMKKKFSLIIYNDTKDEKKVMGYINLPDFLIPSIEEFSIAPKSEKEVFFDFDASMINDYGVIKKYFFIRTDDLIVGSKMMLFSGFVFPYIEPAPKSKRKLKKWEASQPRAQFSRKHIDYGTIGKGSIVTDTILMTNTGKDTLKIKKIFSACGCLRVSAENGEIPPGKSVVLTVTFDTINRRDRQRKEAYLILDDPKNKLVFITTDSQVTR